MRVQVAVPVLCKPERGTAFGGVVANLSRGGARIECNLPPPRHMQIVLAARLPGLPELSRIPSTVRWSSARAFGVRFDGLDPSVACRISELVADSVRTVR